MFDPTAFDNMKVVIEGVLYDMDINGEIIITDRNDFVNLAKMSREFEFKFELKGESRVSAKIKMEANLANLAAEILPNLQSTNLAGCEIQLQFFLNDMGEINNFQELQTELIEIWGSNRKISQTILSNPLVNRKERIIRINIEFDRLVHEDQMEDLSDLINVTVTTVKHLQSFYNK
jgi:hypothetical protein